MEDVARLAVIEQTLSDLDKFNKVLHDLLQQIDLILKNPQDLGQRALKTDDLKKAIEHEVFCDYLKYIGFEPVNCLIEHFSINVPIKKYTIAE